jgi:hypothetical protein
LDNYGIKSVLQQKIDVHVNKITEIARLKSVVHNFSKLEKDTIPIISGLFAGEGMICFTEY